MFGVPRDELLARISSQEITDWIAELSIRSHEAESKRTQAEMMQKIKGKNLASRR